MTLFENIRDSILNFKLRLCCFVAPVRVGILLFGYYNIITSVIALIAVATGSFPPLYMHAQQTFMDGEYVKSSGAFTCCAELSANTLLLSGLYRRDIPLLQYFTYVGLAMAAGTLLVYGMVLGVLDMLTTLLVIISLTYQLYVILLVRSFIVEIRKEAARNAYKARFTYNNIRPMALRAPENYCVEIEPTTPQIPEIDCVTPSPVPPETVVIEEVVSDGEDEIKPLEYPFKFVAIKIPKEEPIKEEAKKDVDKELKGKDGTAKEVRVDGSPNETKVNEGTSKEVKAKEETSKEDTAKEGKAKEVKKSKKSFFGRKQKTKTEERKTPADEPEKP